LLLFLSSLGACSSSDESSVESFVFGECQRPALEKSMALPAENEKIATVTVSDGKTHIYLSSVMRSCESSAKIKCSKKADTLKLENYFSENNYYQSSCSCSSSLDLILDYAEEGIKYVAYGEEVYQAMPER
jgi:hypothetical protein